MLCSDASDNATEQGSPLRLTSVSTTLPLLMGSVKAVKKIVVVAPLFLPRVGLRLTPQENWFVDSGVRRIVSERQKQRRAYAKR